MLRKFNPFKPEYLITPVPNKEGRFYLEMTRGSTIKLIAGTLVVPVGLAVLGTIAGKIEARKQKEFDEHFEQARNAIRET